ncbi:hypothetical protein [Legionella sp.]
MRISISVNARCLDLSSAEEIEYVQFDGKNWAESIADGDALGNGF